ALRRLSPGADDVLSAGARRTPATAGRLPDTVPRRRPLPRGRVTPLLPGPRAPPTARPRPECAADADAVRGAAGHARHPAGAVQPGAFSTVAITRRVGAVRRGGAGAVRGARRVGCRPGARAAPGRHRGAGGDGADGDALRNRAERARGLARGRVALL